MTRRVACLLICALVVLACTGASLGAPEPSPQELWKVYPLDPTAGGTDERRPTTTEAARPSPPPSSGVAGTSATKRTRTVAKQEVAARDDGDTPVSFALLLGGLAGAILLLGLAALPQKAAVRLAGWRGDRRLDLALAGGVTLLVATVVYVVSAY